MERIENQNIEFKQEYVSEIRKEAVVFANSDGGIIRIGIRKDGIVVGISDPDAVMVQTVNSLKDSIAPDIMPFVSIQALEMDGKVIVEIQIAPGTNRPYYIREKGLRPSGVYVRKGSSSQPVTDEGIRIWRVSFTGCHLLKAMEPALVPLCVHTAGRRTFRSLKRRRGCFV